MKNPKMMTKNNSLDEVEYSKITYFFWWCSGAVIGILEKLPTEKNKYVGMGAAIFGTWMLATFSGIFAFNTIFKSLYIAIFIGIVYGMMIFNLDRFITSSMKKVGGPNEVYLFHEKIWNTFYNEWIPAIPRILIAILIGLAISKPLELKLFDIEIQEQLEIDNKKNLKKYRDLLNVTVAQKKNELEERLKSKNLKKSSIQKFINLKQDEWNKEVGGKNIGPEGEGKIAKNIRTEINDAKIEKESVEKEIKLVNAEIGSIDFDKNELIEQYKIGQLAKIGFFKKIEALSNLTNDPDNESIWWSNFLITCLIILIETAPIFVKLISARGPYDAELDYLNKKIMIARDKDIKNMIYSKK